MGGIMQQNRKKMLKKDFKVKTLKFWFLGLLSKKNCTDFRNTK